MQTFLRLTVLGVFGAAGVAVAIAVAIRADSVGQSDGAPAHPTPIEKRAVSQSATQSEHAALMLADASADSAPDDVEQTGGSSKRRPEDAEEGVSPIREANSQSASSLPAPAAPTREAIPSPQSSSDSSAIREMKKELDDALARMREAAVNSEIQLLKTQIHQLTERERIDNQQAAPIVQPAAAVVPFEAAATQSDDPPDDATSNDVSEIYVGEGDGALEFNFAGADIHAAINAISREGELNVVASEKVTGKVTCSFSNVSARTALDAIVQSKGYKSRQAGEFILVGTPQEIQAMDRSGGDLQMEVYHTNYITAAELQQLITPLLTPDVGVATVSTQADIGIPASTVETGGDDFAGNEVVIVHDFASVHAKIDEVIGKVDRPPRQVLIEAMILSVNLDDEHKFGINFELFKNSGSLALASGTPLASLGSIDFSSGGLNFGLLRSGAGAFIAALEQIGDTNVIAAPRLLCLNKQRAEILIGDQKGFISTTQTETSTTQSVEFLDIGTQLRIRPFISDDGVIRLEVHPELSTGDVKLIGEFALPEKSVTQVTTNIMCRDGCTVVLGGLIREDYSKQLSQVAGAGNLPVFGALFRNKNEAVTRNEIIVLITPRIIEDPSIADLPLKPDIFGRQSTIDSARMSRIARRCHSERYYRLAQTSWVAGNVPEALRYLDLSLQFQPRNMRARHLYGVVTGGLHEHESIEGEVPSEQPLPIPAQEASNVEQLLPAAPPNVDPAPVIPFEPIDDVNFESD